MAEVQGVSVGVHVRVCKEVQVGNVLADFCREGMSWLTSAESLEPLGSGIEGSPWGGRQGS